VRFFGLVGYACRWNDNINLLEPATFCSRDWWQYRFTHRSFLNSQRLAQWSFRLE
jgi:hypothetical protein